MSVNFDRVCRLCLSSRCELLPIFPTTSSDDSDPPVLASKIKDCVSVQISENDDLPTNVCRKCMDNVNNWHIFKAVCDRSQNKLQSIKNKGSSQLEELNIKSEPLSDGVYDEGVAIDGSYPDSENAGPSSKLQPEGPPILASLGLTPRSDKKYIDPRMDWQRVHAILDMVQEDEVIDSLQSMEECDVIHQSDHDSETEVELSYEAVGDDYVDYKKGYLCKNRKVILKKPKLTPEDTIARIKEGSILRKRSFVSNKQCAQPRSAWQMLFTDDLLELIVTSTNERIVAIGKKHKPTNISEIRTLIGILYYHGIMRPTHQKISDLWHEEYGAICVKNAMTYERFKLILENMSFDSEDDSIIQFDVMKRLRKVFEIFALNCRTSKEVSNMVVIDEILLPIHGPCPFRYNIKKKSLKTGIKLMLLIDPVDFYVTNLDVITDPYFGSDEIAAKLVQHLAGTGRTIIMDSWFTSDSLINRLKNEYDLFTIGALHPNDENIPPLFLSHYRKKKTFISGFMDKDKTLSSYVNQSLKVINVLTNDPKFYKKGNTSHTSVVSFYNKYHSAVEVLDVLMHYYTTMQHTNDWTLSLFFMLLNIGAVNAQVIWSSQDQTHIMQRRLFIRELAMSLMGTKESNLYTPLLTNINFKRPKFSLPEHVVPFYKNRRRCKICFKSSLKRDRRTKQFCIKCGIFICKEHTVNLCTTCVAP